ncbi:restriction endonuclease subunit S [Streptomyces sp. IBSBF 3352]|uniref:restriction endonuclease subunit S n=1 Tax=Streptomyces sp. IBSBF 3352 TaxID=2903523 RepID=UPI002FDBC66B
MSLTTIRLGDLMVSRSGTVNPLDHPDEEFILYSIPAFDSRRPESITGRDIGSTKQVVRPGDILLSKIVPHIRRAWVVGEHKGTRIIASSEWIVFRRDDIHAPYLKHVLVGDSFHREFMNTVAGVGGSLLRARPAHVAKIEVPLPSLTEQKRIAVLLDQVDVLRAKRRLAITLLDELAQSLFVDMFAGDSRPWPVVAIEDLCSVVVDCVNRTAPVVDEVTPFKMIRTTNVRNGRIDLHDVRHVTEETFHRWNRRAIPQRGDVVFTREAPVGEAGVIETDEPVFLGQRLMLYRPHPDRSTAAYLATALMSPQLRAQYEQAGSGSTVKHLSLPTCRKLKVPAPPISAQRDFEARTAALRRQKAVHHSQLTALDELFTSLQQRAFTGTLWEHEATA